SRSTPTKTRNVTALSRNRKVKVPGRSVRAIAPATSPPRAMPRFIVMRCCANAECRRARGVSELSSVDWLGQKEPLPAPARTFRANACHGVRMSGKSANAVAIKTSAPLRTARGPRRSDSAPPTNPEQSAAAAFDEPIGLRDAWHVLLHLQPLQVVARVSAGRPFPEGPKPDDVVRELAVAAHAARAGAPVVPPADEVEAVPYEHGGHIVTFWRYV